MELVYPGTLVLMPDRYQFAHAVLEAVRQKHNSRIGDHSAEANFFRRECYRVARKALTEQRRLRRAQGWTLKAGEDPGEHPATIYKLAGKADWESVDLKVATGEDLDAVKGSLVLPDPVENFTTYTVVDGTDASGSVTVTATKIDADGIRNGEDTYVYDDKGAAHFGATFAHHFEVTVQEGASENDVCGCWACSNTLDDIAGWEAANNQAVYIYARNGTTDYYILWESENDDYDAYTTAWTAGVKDYVAVERTESTAIEARFYSDAAHENWDDTISVALTDGRTYQHVFALVSKNDAAANRMSMDIENLDLNEAVAFIPYPFPRGLRGGHSALTGGLS